MGTPPGMDWFCSELRRLRGGGLAGVEAKNESVSFGIFGLHSRAIGGSANDWVVVDLCRDIYLIAGPEPPYLDFLLRRLNAIQASLNDWLESGRGRLPNTIQISYYDFCWGDFSEVLREASIPSYAVVVSAVVLLSFVYKYLTGNVDSGSSKAYSRSSLDFRDIYVAVVLFLGAYVWIKFREVAFKGVYSRQIVDKRGHITKVVYEPRFKPPRENGTVFQWIYLGQYATPEEASILYQIAAFYYNEGQGGSLDLGDGRWFSIPPMSEGERSLTGADKRAWVKDQAMRVYKEFRNEKEEAAEEAALLQEVLEAWEDQATPRQGVEPSEEGLLNSAEHELPLLVSPLENSGMAMAMLDDQGLECAPQSFGGMHEGFVTFNGHSLTFQEESAIPISQATPDTQSGMGISNSNQLNIPQIVQNQQELIKYQHEQISSLQQQLQESTAENSVLQNHQRVQQQQLEESRNHNSQLEYQLWLQEQLQVINEGVPSFEVEQSMPSQNHPCRPHGSAFW